MTRSYKLILAGGANNKDDPWVYRPGVFVKNMQRDGMFVPVFHHVWDGASNFSKATKRQHSTPTRFPLLIYAADSLLFRALYSFS